MFNHTSTSSSFSTNTCWRRLTNYHQHERLDAKKKRPRKRQKVARSCVGQERDLHDKLTDSSSEASETTTTCLFAHRESQVWQDDSCRSGSGCDDSNQIHQRSHQLNEILRKLALKKRLWTADLSLVYCCYLLLLISCCCVAATADQMVANLPSSYRLVLGEYPPSWSQPPVAQPTSTWPTLDRATSNQSSAQSYMERRNFGKRLQLNLTEAVLARTLRQLNALNVTSNWSGASGNVTTSRRDTQVNEQPNEQQQQQQQVTRRDFISNLLKYRLLRPSSLLGETWANLTGRHVLQNASHHWLTNPSNDSYLSGQSTSGWLDSEESTPVVSVIKPLTGQVNSSMSSLSTDLAARDYQVVALDKQAATTAAATAAAAAAPPISVVSSSSNSTISTQLPLNHSTTPSYNNHQPHWQESNIDQVISLKNKDHHQVDTDGQVSGGGANELKQAAQSKSGSGERMKDDEKSSFWKKQRHGEQQQAGSGKKDAKEGAKFVKDMGHNKHGWKNVYHKEEYAQHQKFHDVFRDKNWDNKKAKLDERYDYKKGNKFNDTKSSDHYDKDKHGSKYDYSKGDHWKRYEDDHYDGGSEDAVKETGKKLDDWELDAPLNQQQQQQQQHQQHLSGPPEQPSEQQASLYSQQSELNEDLDQPQQHQQHIGSDDAVIEQMKDKLERLSAQTQQHYNGGAGMTPTSAESEPSGQVVNGDDYDGGGDWSTGAESAPSRPQPLAMAPTSDSLHQSVNEIVKTAKRVSGKQQQQLGGAGYSEPIIIRNSSTLDHQHSNHSPGGGHQLSGESSQSDDTNDGEGENEPELSAAERSRPPQNSSRKNELRLKLELDLGRSVAQRAQSNSTRRNNQVQVNSQQTAQVQQPRVKSETRDDNSSHHRQHQQGANSSHWQPKDRESGPNKVLRDQAPRSNQQTRLKQLPTRDPPPQTSVNSPPTKLGSSPPTTSTSAAIRQRRPTAGQQQVEASGGATQLNANHQQGQNNLNNLAQVLPGRPIFVKHLQMNGGVVLGKLNGFTNNRSIEHSIATPSMMSEEVTVENPFGDMITLPGFNQLQVAPQQMVESQPTREYMLVFGEQQAASGAQPHHHHHLLEDEPNVIFEATAINQHASPDLSRPTFSATNYHESLPDLESLMSEQQGRFSMASNGQLVFSARPPVGQKQVMQSSQQQQTYLPKPAPPVSQQDQTAISNLLKLANSFNYSSSLINNGPSIGGNIVAPTMQQAISRFLRFPRVFGPASSGYKPPYSQHLKAQESRPSLSFSKLVAGSFNPLRGLSVISHHRQPNRHSHLQQNHYQQQQHNKNNQQQQQQQQQQQMSHYHKQQQHQQQVIAGDLLEAASKGVPVTSIQPIMIAAASLRPPSRPPRNNVSGDGGEFKTNNSASQTQSANNEERKKGSKVKKKKKRVKKSGHLQKSTVADNKASSKSKGEPIRFDSNLNLTPDHSRTIPVQWTMDDQGAADPSAAKAAVESSMTDQVNYLNQQQLAWLSAPVAPVAHTKMMMDAFNVQSSEANAPGSRIRANHSNNNSPATSMGGVHSSQSQHTVSTRTPNFGERILKSFKSKLSISGKTPDSGDTNYD